MSPWGLVSAPTRFKDQDIINRCSVDRVLLPEVSADTAGHLVPIALVVIPVLIPTNYVGGIGQPVTADSTQTGEALSGLDTLAWSRVPLAH